MGKINDGLRSLPNTQLFVPLTFPGPDEIWDASFAAHQAVPKTDLLGTGEGVSKTPLFGTTENPEGGNDPCTRPDSRPLEKGI